MKKKIKNDRGRKENGGIVQGFARNDRLEKRQGEECQQNSQQDIIAEVEHAGPHQQVLDLHVKRGRDQQDQEV